MGVGGRGWAWVGVGGRGWAWVGVGGRLDGHVNICWMCVAGCVCIASSLIISGICTCLDTWFTIMHKTETECLRPSEISNL